jgi:hypothetical protein
MRPRKMYNAILEVTVKCAQIVKTHPSFNGPVFLFSYLEWSERKATMGSAQVVSGSDSPYCVRRRMHACPCMRAYMCMCMFACVATRAVSNVRVDGCTHTCTVQSHVRLFCERMFMRRRTPDGLMAHLADNGYEPTCIYACRMRTAFLRHPQPFVLSQNCRKIGDDG